MTEQTEVKEISNLLKDLFTGFEKADEDQFLSVTHPEVRTVNIGNTNDVNVFSAEDICKYSIRGLRSAMERDPKFYAKREISAIHDIRVYEVIASADVEYRMVMPDAIGIHRSFYHFVKVNGKWQVMNIIDRGRETKKGST